MSAFCPKADLKALIPGVLANVCFRPKADITAAVVALRWITLLICGQKSTLYLFDLTDNAETTLSAGSLKLPMTHKRRLWLKRRGLEE